MNRTAIRNERVVSQPVGLRNLADPHDRGPGRPQSVRPVPTTPCRRPHTDRATQTTAGKRHTAPNARCTRTMASRRPVRLREVSRRRVPGSKVARSPPLSEAAGHALCDFPSWLRRLRRAPPACHKRRSRWGLRSTAGSAADAPAVPGPCDTATVPTFPFRDTRECAAQWNFAPRTRGADSRV
jgi:hypothetical protein